MGTTPASFGGASRYAADLQQAIDHALTIAALPLNQLNRNVSLLQGQLSELSVLQNKFSAIQTALQNLSSSTGSNGLAASVSDNSVATVTLDPNVAVATGTYVIHVVSAGAPTTTLSDPGLPAVPDPSSTSISSSGSFTLTVDGSPITINPSANSLNALAQAINASGAGVSATIINLGPPSAPVYRLSLQSTTLGNVAIQLNDGTQDLLSNLSTGSPAQYQVDGQPSTPISANTDSVTIAPGLTVDLRGAGTTTITVARNPSAAADALSSFAAAYNAAVDELGHNRGTAGGSLKGQSIVFSLQQALRDLTGYSGGSGAVQNVTDLGLTFDKQGHLSFDQTQFSSVASAHPADVAAFLGSVPGSGFLKSAADLLNNLESTTNGTFQSVTATVQQRIDADNQQISTTQDRLLTLQNQLVAQMSAADALIASLESQVSYFTLLFEDTQNAVRNR